MSSTVRDGNMLKNRTRATGVIPPSDHLINRVATVGFTVGHLGTGGVLTIDSLQRMNQKGRAHFQLMEPHEAAPVRTLSENLVRIREVLKPAVSDLAVVFDVSRQSVYNWLNGEPVAEVNAAKLQDLAQAADILIDAGITVNSTLLKRKFANGRTLMQVAQAGDSARDAAVLLVQINRREAAQRERMNARFATRMRTPATADFDLPAPNDPILR